MAILGLLDAEKFTAQRFKNIRRSVFYFYPNGAAPMVGLLSLLDEESTNDPEFYWQEKVKDDQRTVTVANTTGAFMAAAANVDTSSPWAIGAGVLFRVTLLDATKFRVGHIVRLPNVPLTAGGTTTLTGRVETVFGGTGAGGFFGAGGAKQGLELRTLEIIAGVSNTAATVGLEALIVGFAASEGQIGAAPTLWNLPVQQGNYTQIMRTPFQMTGTAAKTSATFDETGPYKDKSKEATINHSQEMEKNFIFGRKLKTTDASTGLPLRYTGGVLWFLEQWEAVGTPNSYGRLGATLDTQDDKRIIGLSSGVITEKLFDGYLERLFRVTNNKTNEKLCLCGSGALLTMNQLYRGKSVMNVNQGTKEQTYGMTVVTHMTPFGSIHYRSHPLFSENPILRFAMLFLDVHNLKYRYMDGRDTTLLKHRQANNADYREDEFLSECGLELRFPQSHMYIQNVLDWS